MMMPCTKECQHPPEDGKSKEMDSVLKPLEGVWGLLSPWFWPHETVFGCLASRAMREGTSVLNCLVYSKLLQ